MKKHPIFIGIVASVLVAVGLVSCEIDDDWFQPELANRIVSGTVVDSATHRAVKGIYLGVWEGKDCDWAGDCNEYKVYDDAYTSITGGFLLRYYGPSFVKFKMRKTEVSVYVDSLATYKPAIVESYYCPALGDYWHTAGYYQSIQVDDTLKLEIVVALKLKGG
ncbi:MAG: hypothetical protein H6577_27780 [Lewinellaceae bacterium]|nr:hypothetical protein [Lewinellaceae bacterium]